MRFRRWLPQILLALGVALPVITFPASTRAEDHDDCAPLEYFTPLADRFPVFRIFHGDQITKASLAYNEATEGDGTEWPSAYVVIRQDGWAFLMVGGVGTVCRFAIIPPGQIEEMLRQIEGLTV